MLLRPAERRLPIRHHERVHRWTASMRERTALELRVVGKLDLGSHERPIAARIPALALDLLDGVAGNRRLHVAAREENLAALCTWRRCGRRFLPVDGAAHIDTGEPRVPPERARRRIRIRPRLPVRLCHAADVGERMAVLVVELLQRVPLLALLRLDVEGARGLPVSEHLALAAERVRLARHV
eukprot:5299337-Prymnesium_polylepis.1